MTKIAFIRKAITGLVDSRDDGGVQHFGFAVGTRQEAGMQTDIENMDLACPGFVLRHQESGFIDLEAKGMCSADDRIAPGAAADVQTTGDIDGDDLIAGAVEVFDQLGRYPFQFPVKARAE